MKTEGGAQTLLRGLSVLEAVAHGSCTLAEIGKTIGCTRSTTQRLTSTLVQNGYLRQVASSPSLNPNTTGPVPGSYALGPKLIELGFLAREDLSLAVLARPYLEELAAETQDTVHLGVPEGTDVLYLDKIAGKRGLEMRSRIGTRMPMAVTGVGKALMLDMEEAHWRALYEAALSDERQRGTPPTWNDYEQSLSRYAAQGVALDFAENEIGIHCVAAPIRDASGAIVAAVSVASATMFMPAERMQALSLKVIATASEISSQLGWQATQARHVPLAGQEIGMR